uniref:Transmembrane protein 59 n=1 Tax=Tetraodon nigroviridis TaxID=99883 RepID=Q8UWE8_TETNG|nr:AF290615-like protein [Tetraodon nigroviridis]
MGVLSYLFCVLGPFVLFAYASASPDVFDSVLGNTASCQKSCEMTYTLHTYPRGCRLFSICQFVRDIEDLNQTKTDCESSCREAYSETDEQYACNLGCQNQLPFAEQRQEQLDAMMPRIHLLYPLTLVRGFWEDVMNQAHSLITSSWTFYLQADDGKVVIFQTEPQIKYFTQFELQKDGEEEAQRSLPGFSNPVFRDYHRTLIQERDRDGNAERSYDGDYNLFSCLSRNPWLPGWILTTTLVLSVLVLIWICCATVATAVDQYTPAEKLSIYGDKEYMNEQKLTPYPASSLLIVATKAPMEEAEPLPWPI